MTNTTKEIKLHMHFLEYCITITNLLGMFLVGLHKAVGYILWQTLPQSHQTNFVLMIVASIVQTLLSCLPLSRLSGRLIWHPTHTTQNQVEYQSASIWQCLLAVIHCIVMENSLSVQVYLQHKV